MSDDQAMRKALAGIRTGRPRVMATPERAAAVRGAPAHSPVGRLADAMVAQAEQILPAPPVGYEKEGRRLLHVSRQALHRLARFGIAWLRSGDDRFVRRAELEIQAVCTFPDWNPSHYLDTAEMALAVAFAYDWMHEALTPDVREVARAGLVRHVFGTAFPPDDTGWPEARNNWGQVCHAGLAAAALALADEEPETACRILGRAVRNVPLAAACYAPDGDYPEGPIYWDYGTSFHVVLLEVLRSALSTDFGLGAMPGFMASAASVLHLTGPTGHLYGFADGSSSSRCFSILLWFDAEGGITLPPDAPERKAVEAVGMVAKGRLDPLAVFWADRLSIPSAEAALPLDHFGRGSQPVLALRSAWGNREAWYVGVKGGSPQGPHGHMDGGSFILEARGERWVVDLGAENYHQIESLGLDLWDSSQDSDRWRVFRLSTAAHSVLQIDDAQQCAAGHAKPLTCVVGTPDPSSQWDLTSLYPAAKRVERRFAFPERGALCVTDLVEGLPAGSRVTWSFPTRADVVQHEEATGVAILRQNGRELHVSASGDGLGTWQVNAAESLLQPHDSPLPDVRLVSIEAVVPESGSVEINVRFM